MYSQRQLDQTAGDFLHTLQPWNTFATLTFRGDVPDALARHSFKDWLRALSETTGNHIPFAYGFGPQRRGIAHYHVLLVHPGGSTVGALSQMRSYWRMTSQYAGHIKIDPFDATRGGAYYQAKHPEWDANVACPRLSPRCRRDYCAEAPSAW